MCDDHARPDTRDDAGNDDARGGISRRGLLAGVGTGFGLALTGLPGTAQAAPATTAMNGAWCNPAQGSFPSGGGFHAPRGGGLHLGQDISNPSGTPLYAAAAGTVIRRGVAVIGGRTGNGIVIQHAGGMFTYYGHLDAFRVALNARVAAGARIGDMGTTGNVTGPHVHFETHSGSLGNPVDPVPFMAARGVDLRGGWSRVNPGASGQRVRAIQHLLNQRRGAGLLVDGVYGSVSSGAMRAFQSANGLAADGQVGPQTWPVLVYSLRRGAGGSHVRALQTALNKRSAGLAVDGDFGGVTESALRTYQSGNRLVVDGLAGPVTWRALVG